MIGKARNQAVGTTRLWEVSTRVIVYAAIGAALYGVAGLFSFILPGTQNVAIRPAFGLVTFFGLAFGPVAGFFVGFVGNAIIDQILGSGLLTYWNWSLANGLVGLLAGVFGFYLLRQARTGILRRRTQAGPALFIGAAAVALLATWIGFLAVILDIWIQGISFNAFLTLNYFPVVLANSLPAVIITPLLLAAWLPLQRQIGR